MREQTDNSKQSEKRKIPMRAVVINHRQKDAKPISIPIPLPDTTDELDAVLKKFDATVEGDYDDEILYYTSQLGVVPEVWEDLDYVIKIAEYLAKLSTEQFNSLRKLCRAFELDFSGVSMFFDFIMKTKVITEECFLANGVPTREG